MTTYFKQGLDVTGDVNVVGNVTVSETVTSNDIDVGELIIYQSYIQHSENNNSIGFDNGNNLVITGYTGEVQLYANADGGTQPWKFKSTGELQTPDSGVININGTTLTDNSYTVYGNQTAIIASTEGPIEITANSSGSNKTWQFTQSGNIIFPDLTSQSTAFDGTASPNNLFNEHDSSAVIVVDGVIAELFGLSIRIVNNAGSLGVEINYDTNYVATISAYQSYPTSTNVFSGVTTTNPGNTTWLPISNLSNIGDSLEFTVADHSFHHIYRTTVISRSMPGVGVPGDAYCILEKLK